MGAGYSIKCDKCDFVTFTNGSWEFYRDENGKRKPYGHPCPASKEAEEAGIQGLSGELYCSDCGEVSDLIIVEFKKSTNETLYVWGGMMEPKEEYKTNEGPNCPKCGSLNIFLEIPEDKNIKCIKCDNGNLSSEMEWIS